MNANIKSLFLIILIAIISACQKAPQTEMDEAKALLDSAQIENIQDTYLEEFQVLKDSVNAVLEGIEGEKSKFASTKYNQYKEQLKSLIKETKQLIQKNKYSKEVEELPEI
jgi:ElaB/YqjD/DUF883 family membrane-anchored ribosome-binding protein